MRWIIGSQDVFETRLFKRCHNSETNVHHTKEHFWPYVWVWAYVWEKGRESSSFDLNLPLFCYTAWHIFIQLDLIISGNSQFTMYDISTQYTTIDESRHVKQLQMITDYIIASEYIPKHLIYWQNTSSSEPLWTHRPAAELCSKLHPYVTCLTLSLQIHQLILSFSPVFSTFSPACLNLVFLPLRCWAVGLLMVRSICHGLEVANLTCSLGLALL